VGLALAIASTATLLAGPTPVLTGCEHRPQVRPAGIVLACGDGNFYVTRLTWTRWSPREAVARGVGYENDCRPNCAAGHFHTYLVELRLSRVVGCVAHRLEFSTIAWRFVAAKPAHVPRAGSETLPCRFLRLHP
jgi:hypothetical protein